MSTTDTDFERRLGELEEELSNFKEIMGHVRSAPSQLRMRHVDVSGQTFPLTDEDGGDHIIFVDFSERYDLDRLIQGAQRAGEADRVERLRETRNRIGVLLADASGHSTTDALLTAMLHQAFLTGVLYELEMNGHVTPKLFEILNTRFHRSSAVTKYLTMIYGEISDAGRFKFISAGHPKPMIFSAEFDAFVEIDPSRLTTFFPVGMFPTETDVEELLEETPPVFKKNYTVNEVNLMAPGDILILMTDGVVEHSNGEESFTPGPLQDVVRRTKGDSAREMVEAIRGAMEDFADPEDDASLVVIKRTT
jgi:serine phosphatase RsbU (regulator of sigma subunit)